MPEKNLPSRHVLAPQKEDGTNAGRWGQEFIRIAASSAMLLIIVFLLLYLTFIPVPAENKDIIITILGVLLGAGAAAIPNLFGDNDKAKERLLDRVRVLEREIVAQRAENETLHRELTEIRTMLIDRHVVKGEGLR